MQNKMSTELKTLKAKLEVPKKDGSMSSNYKDVDVQLNRFWGGEKRGVSLQFTFLGEDDNYHHFQLDKENVLLLLSELKENFNE
jgi:hypothetical protein